MDLKLNLRFLLVAILAAYAGFIGGGIWQAEKTHQDTSVELQIVKGKIDKAFSDGQAWGRAECAGKKWASKANNP